MAVDTRDKRASSLQRDLSFLWTLPLPDGSVDTADRQHSARSYVGIAPTVATAQEGTTARTFFWKAQDRKFEWTPQDRTLEWNEQKRSFAWDAQNRTFVWPLEYTDVTAKFKSPKDPGDISNWTADYSAEMNALSDTIATSSWTVGSEATEVAESNTTTTASVKVSGGTAGDKVDLTNTITTTTSGETFERTHELTIKEVAS